MSDRDDPSKGGVGYPLWDRNRALRVYDSLPAGESVTDRVAQAAAAIGSSERSVYRFLAKRARSGNAAREAKSGGQPSVLSGVGEMLLLLYYGKRVCGEGASCCVSEAYPDAFEYEAADVLSVLLDDHISPDMIHAALQRNRITQKALHRTALQQDPIRLHLWWHMPHPVGITDTNINYLVDFDESSLYIERIGRRFGRAYIGRQARVYERYGRGGVKLTIVLAVGIFGVVSYWLMLEDMNNPNCLEWIQLFLLPALGVVVPHTIMCDNLKSHRSKPVRDAVAASPHRLLFRPPYAPEVAPVEVAFHLIKAELRRRRRELTSDNWRQIVAQVIEELDPGAIRAIFRHCGYRVP